MNRTLYLPDDLDDEVQAAGIPMSRAFQEVVKDVLARLADDDYRADTAGRIVALMAPPDK